MVEATNTSTRRTMSALHEAGKAAKDIAPNLKKLATTTNPKELVDSFIGLLPVFCLGIDRKADAISIGHLGEATVVVGPLKGSEFLYVRGRGRTPPRLIVHRSLGFGFRPIAGAGLHLYARSYYGDPEAITKAPSRQLVDIGAGVGVVSASVSPFVAPVDKGRTVTGFAASFNTILGPGAPVFQEAAVLDVRERVERIIDLSSDEAARIEAVLASAPDHSPLRSLVERRVQPGPVPSSVVDVAQTAKGSVGRVFTAARAFPFVRFAEGARYAKGILPVALGVDAAAVGAAIAADTRAGDKTYARSRYEAGRALGGTGGAVLGAVLAAVAGALTMKFLGGVWSSGAWATKTLRLASPEAVERWGKIPGGVRRATMSAASVLGSITGALVGGRLLGLLAAPAAPSRARGGGCADASASAIPLHSRPSDQPGSTSNSSHLASAEKIENSSNTANTANIANIEDAVNPENTSNTGNTAKAGRAGQDAHAEPIAASNAVSAGESRPTVRRPSAA